MSAMSSGPSDAMAMNGQLQHGALPMDHFDHDLGFDDPLLFVLLLCFLISAQHKAMRR